MFLLGILSWWYLKGWLERFYIIKRHIESSVDLFSVGLLASTLFSPFRQISAGRISGSVVDQLHAFIDRSISRLIGAFVRSSMIIIGSLVISFQFIVGVLILLIWPFIPILPVIGLILMVIGWVPKWTI